MIDSDLGERINEKITIHFIHEAPTPHNNFLLDAVAGDATVQLFRHYLLSPSTVPGRPWKTMGCGEVQANRIFFGYGRYFNWKLVKLVLLDTKSVFFIIGWGSPILVVLLLILGLRRRPLLMWDDGPTLKSIELISQWWRPKQFIKRILIQLINKTPGTYFYTGEIKIPLIVGLGIARHKLKMLPFFVPRGDVSSQLRELHCGSSKNILILAGGRLIRSKGYDVFISSLAALKQQKLLGWKAVLIGSGPEIKCLQMLVKEHRLYDLVDFIPWAEPEVFTSYIHTADIFVAPARFDHFPTTIITAMQAGVPVVATNQVGSAVEFIKSGSNGTIVPSDNPASLADALAQLINDPIRRKVIGSAGKVTISQWPVDRGVRLILGSARSALTLRISTCQN